jgi:naphthoate synthase
VALNFMGDMMYPAWRHGTELLRYIWGSEESLEGMRGFSEKKTPNFRKFRRN